MKKTLLTLSVISLVHFASAQCVTPADPTPVTATPNTVCSNTSVSADLNGTSPGNTIIWYTVPSGGTPIGSSASGANFNVNVSSTTTYYAEAFTTGGTAIDTFLYTGAPQFFIVPGGVDSVRINAYGAEGGSASSNPGGLGGNAQGWYTVAAGETLWVYVGGKGQNHNFAGGIDYEALGGWNGGGKGGYDNSGQVENGGGGGGASDVRHLDTTLNGRIIVAAGGGGGAGGFFSGAGGGNGGGAIGTDGGFTYTALGGTGGTQSAGGVAATLTRGATNGAFGIGGNGSTNQNAWGSGGAGGGYYGGGGGTSTMDHSSGHAAAGGGGSSYIGSLSGSSTTAGVRYGDGMVIIEYPSGCASLGRTPVTVTINPLPTVSANATPNDSVCDGSNITLSGGGASSYSWAGPAAATDNTPFAMNMSGAGMYTVTGTDANSCSNTATVTIVVNALPTVVADGDTSLCPGGTATLIATGANTYTWDNGAGSGSPVTVNPVSSTDYVVTGTVTGTGCQSTDTVSVTIIDCSGIESEELISISIYPNPTSGIIWVNSEIEILRAEVVDINGKVLQHLSNVSSNPRIDLTMQPAGLYMIRFYTNDGMIAKRIIRE